MEANHTQTPWELDPPDQVHVTSEDYHVIRAGCGFLAEAKDVREPGFRIAGHMTEADARLIAAAPDLLAAASKALAECADLFATPAGEALEAAIAKATGSAA